jgi:hypothetical protein
MDRYLYLLRAAKWLRVSEISRHRLFLLLGAYSDDIFAVLNPAEKTINHIPNVNSREASATVPMIDVRAYARWLAD